MKFHTTFKGYDCLKRNKILIKIRNTRLDQGGQKALLKYVGCILLIGVGWGFFNPER
jgi:hypothetical protein